MFDLIEFHIYYQNKEVDYQQPNKKYLKIQI